MTAHQIAILALSTLLFGMLSLQSFKRNKKAKMPLESDENYFSHTAYEIPDSKYMEQLSQLHVNKLGKLPMLLAYY